MRDELARHQEDGQVDPLERCQQQFRAGPLGHSAWLAGVQPLQRLALLLQFLPQVVLCAISLDNDNYQVQLHMNKLLGCGNCGWR